MCRRCLDEDPEARPAAPEVARVLADAAGVQLAPFPQAPPEPEPPPDEEHPPTRVLDEPPPGPPPAAPAPASRPPGRRPLVIAGAGIGAAGLAALLIGLLTPGSSRSSDGTGRPPAPSPSRTTAAVTACSVAYRVDGSWPQGFQATVRITNLGTAAIDGWRLAFDFPDGQSITQVWNAGQRQDGTSVTVTAADWNRSIPPHGTVEFGFLGRRDAGNGRPSRFTLNGGECR
ncbi:cellulose-binding domain-containing protein [Actinomadura nitritigenes]|uniref:Cellulose-binding domain-containing protein n=1 Tax=Actinomadura nitritigenes TaxID=134602 RepID=A0ABS3REN4_9ACTN|nr:cellulose-binding domain-containing protein [Actinomadura nitritigenes]